MYREQCAQRDRYLIFDSVQICVMIQEQIMLKSLKDTSELCNRKSFVVNYRVIDESLDVAKSNPVDVRTRTARTRTVLYCTYHVRVHSQTDI